MNNNQKSNNDEDRQKDTKAWLRQGYSFERKKEYEKAIECYEKALEIDSEYADAWGAKGWALYEIGRFDEAIPCYDKAIEIKPKTPRFWNYKAIAFEGLENFDEALRCYEKAIDVRSNYGVAWCNKGDLLNNQGKHNEAIKCYDKAIQARPKYDYAWYLKGWALLQLNKYEEGLNCFNRAVEIDSKYADFWNGKGWSLFYLGRYDESINCFDNVLKIDPNYEYAWNGKGYDLFSLNRYDESISCFDKAIDLNPDSYAWSAKGEALLELKKYEEAFACYDKYINVIPEDGSAWNDKGVALYYLDRKEEAIVCYDKAIDLDPKEPRYWSNKGESLFDLELYEESLEYYDKSIEIDSEYLDSWNGKGKSLEALGRSSEAEEAFAKARELQANEETEDETKSAPLSEMVLEIKSVLERKGQVILYGPPGTGKTYWAEKAALEMATHDLYGRSFDQLSEEQRISLLGGEDNSGAVRICCFHPAYGYEDFLEGYKPEEINGKMSFVLRDGIFKKLCKDAISNPEGNFYLIIDEINRGDIPRIFGELMTVLEKNKRGKPIILPVSGDLMQVPNNVYIIGTMNTADRSIALLDAALRRRFGFIEVMPDVSVLEDSVVEEIHLGQWLQALNRRICENIGRDARNLQVGHSYLMEKGAPISSLSSFFRVVQDEIIPLLEEYCYEDYSALENLLGEELVDVQRQMIRHDIFEDSREEEFVRVMLEMAKDGSDFGQELMQKSTIPEENDTDFCDGSGEDNERK